MTPAELLNDLSDRNLTDKILDRKLTIKKRTYGLKFHSDKMRSMNSKERESRDAIFKIISSGINCLRARLDELTLSQIIEQIQTQQTLYRDIETFLQEERRLTDLDNMAIEDNRRIEQLNERGHSNASSSELNTQFDPSSPFHYTTENPNDDGNIAWQVCDRNRNTAQSSTTSNPPSSTNNTTEVYAEGPSTAPKPRPIRGQHSNYNTVPLIL